LKVLGCSLVALMVPVVAAQPSLKLAEAQFRAGDCKGVVETLTTLLQSPEASGEAPYELLAECGLRMGRPGQAIQVLRDGIQANPKSAALKRALGQALFRQDPTSTEAEELFRVAAIALASDPESRHYYAQWAYLNNRDEICIQNEREALRLPGLNEVALLQMNTLIGMCQSRLNNTAAARASFRAAHKINLRSKQFDAPSAYQYVRFLSLSGGAPEVESVVEQILERAPRYGPAHLERAKSFDRAHKPDKVIEEAKLVLEGEGNDFTVVRAAHLILAKSYFAMGDTGKAEDEQKWIESHTNASAP
jgi:Tfp pilus assembly protein PilF